MLNKKFFFDYVRGHLFDQRMRQSQIDGLNGILDEWDANHTKKDDRWLAYMLATTHHETDKSMQPIREYGRGKGKPYDARTELDSCALDSQDREGVRSIPVAFDAHATPGLKPKLRFAFKLKKCRRQFGELGAELGCRHDF